MNEIETVTEVHSFEPLAAWLPMKYPRRGGFPSSIPESDPSADLRVDEHLHGTWVVWELDHAPDVDEYVLAARRHRAIGIRQRAHVRRHQVTSTARGRRGRRV